jgi:uncharacterized protein (TIGR00369 family)
MSTFTDAIGLTVEAISAQRVSGQLELSAAHHQPWGVVHGGVWTAAIETVATLGAVQAVAADGLRAVGVHNSCDFVRPFASGTVVIVATAVNHWVRMSSTPTEDQGRRTPDIGCCPPRLSAHGLMDCSQNTTSWSRLATNETPPS